MKRLLHAILAIGANIILAAIVIDLIWRINPPDDVFAYVYFRAKTVEFVFQVGWILLTLGIVAALIRFIALKWIDRRWDGTTSQSLLGKLDFSRWLF